MKAKVEGFVYKDGANTVLVHVNADGESLAIRIAGTEAPEVGDSVILSDTKLSNAWIDAKIIARGGGEADDKRAQVAYEAIREKP